MLATRPVRERGSWCSATMELRVKRVAQPVADIVDAQDGQEDAEAGEERHRRGELDVVLSAPHAQVRALAGHLLARQQWAEDRQELVGDGGEALPSRTACGPWPRSAGARKINFSSIMVLTK